MERARSSIVLKALCLAIVASAVAFIGGGTANAVLPDSQPVADNTNTAVTTDDGGDITVNAGDDLQKIVDSRKAGATVTLSTGTYGGVVTKKPITIIGSRSAIVTKISIESDNVTLKGFTMTGSGTAIVMTKGQYVTVDGLTFVGSYGRTINANGTDMSHFKLLNCDFNYSTAKDNHNVFFNSDNGSDVLVQGNTFRSNVQLRGSDDGMLSDVRFINNTTKHDAAFSSTALTLFDVTGAQIRGNHFNATKDGSDVDIMKLGCAVIMSGGVSNVVVDDNNINGFRDGIDAFYNGKWPTKLGNFNVTITNNRMTTWLLGVYVAGSTNVVNIKGNTITGGILDGIRVTGDQIHPNSDVTIAGNDISSVGGKAINVMGNAVAEGDKVAIECDNTMTSNGDTVGGNADKIDYNCKPNPTPDPDKPGQGGEDNKGDDGDAKPSEPTGRNEHKDLTDTKITAPQTGVRLSKATVAENNASASQTDQTIASAMIALMIATITSIILVGARVVVESKK